MVVVSVGNRGKVDWFSGHSYTRFSSFSFYSSHPKEVRSGWSVWHVQIVGSHSAGQLVLVLGVR